MGSNELKITLLVIAVDRRRAISDSGYLKILLSDDSTIISKTLENSIPIEEVLRELHGKYIEYSYEYAYRILSDVRNIDGGYEVVYTTLMHYVPDFNKAGRVYTPQEIKERQLPIDEYYGQLIAKSGTNSIR